MFLCGLCEREEISLTEGTEIHGERSQKIHVLASLARGRGGSPCPWIFEVNKRAHPYFIDFKSSISNIQYPFGTEREETVRLGVAPRPESTAPTVLLPPPQHLKLGY